MVKQRMDLLELLRKRGMDGDVDFLREALRVLLDGIMDAEVSAQIGAEHGERSPERVTYRNGYRNRTWDTRVGTMELHIPKLREGSYFPSLLEPRRRSEKALLAVIQQAYVEGVSTRRVDDLIKALGCDGISSSQVSRICEQLDEVVEQLREPFAQVAELLADAAPDILAFTAFPVAHWQKLWSNNPQERLNREIRRRRACPRKGTWWAFSPTGCRRGAWWARCWPSNTTNGPKPAATSPSPTPPATRHCRRPICWTQRPDQHQKG